MNKRLVIFFIGLLLLTFIPIETMGISVRVPGKKPGWYQNKTIIYPMALDLISPDSLMVLDSTDYYNGFYAACDQMPRLIGEAYTNINHRPISKDPAIYGTVLVYAQINMHGEVEECKVVQTIYDTGLVEKLVDKIKTSTFYPAMRDYIPVDVWIGIPVTFILKNVMIE